MQAIVRYGPIGDNIRAMNRYHAFRRIEAFDGTKRCKSYRRNNKSGRLQFLFNLAIGQKGKQHCPAKNIADESR